MQQQSAADRLSILLRESHLTAAALSRKVEFSQSHISGVCSGGRGLSPKLALRIRDAMGISADWLLHGEGRPIENRDKAAQYLPAGSSLWQGTEEEASPEELPLALKFTRLQNAEYMTGPTGPARPQSDRVKTSWPLLDSLVADQPARFDDGRRATFPPPATGDLYVVRAEDLSGAIFRHGEFLLIEWRHPKSWSAEALNGEIIVSRAQDDSDLALFRLERIKSGTGCEGGGAEWRHSPLGRGKSFIRSAEETRIHGLLKASFQIRFPEDK
jgi:transcriptional regulator with XRE-family HTH domain